MRADSTKLHDRRMFCAVLAGALALICCGCTKSLIDLPGDGFSTSLFSGDSKKVKTDLDDDDDDFETSIETPLLGDYISIQGNTVIPVRGIGLVTGLNGTGGDPPPSPLRKRLEDEMQIRKIPNASRLLADRSTALVVVTAYVPPMSRKGQPFDVRVVLPPNSNATSLKGGYLLPTRLFEEADVAGQGTLKGHEYASATGPILTAFGADEKEAGGLMTRGSIPGGAIAKDDRDLEILLRKKYQSVRKAKQIATSIAERFHHYDRFSQRIALAEAKTNAMLELKVHPNYRNNFPRYQRVIRSIALSEGAVARRLRMERLAEELLDPGKSEMAAIHLEAIGDDSAPFLTPALESTDPAVRFFAAEALAYLGNSAGVKALSEAARSEPAFRIYALAALSVLPDGESILALRELTSDESLETQYGAVRALTETQSSDHSLNTVKYPNQFIMHQIPNSPVPRVHLARRRVPEVTVFGVDQKLMLPAVLSAGHAIRLVGHEGDETVTLTRYRVGEEPVRRQVSSRLTEILKSAADLGAAYPDIVQMLIEAERQQNLEGELGIDRLPQAGRSYVPGRGKEGTHRSEKTLGSPAMMPGLFDDTSDAPEPTDEVSGLEVLLDSAPDDTAAEAPQPLTVKDLVEGSDEDTVEEVQDEDKPVSNKFRRMLVNPFSKDSSESSDDPPKKKKSLRPKE